MASGRRSARAKSARENYVENLQHGNGLTSYMNKKTKSFSHIQYPDNELAYRSTPEYLRKLLRTAALAATASSNGATNGDINGSNIIRPKSANDLSSKSNSSLNKTFIGNPKYKSPEEYYDEVIALKKQVSSMKDENNSMRAKVRRLEEENTRRIKEIEGLCDTSKDGDFRRIASITDRSNNTANVVVSLKQKLFKLEQQMKEKEAAITEIHNDPNYTKSVETEIQNKALKNEIERQKVEKMKILENNYHSTLQEEMKNAIQKLDKENKELQKENKMLRKKLDEVDQNQNVSSREPKHKNTDDDVDKQTQNEKERDIKKLNETIEKIKRDRDHYREQLNETENELSKLKREYERNEHNFKSKLAIGDSGELSGGRSSPSRMTPPTKQSTSNLKRDDLSHRPSSPSLKRSKSPSVRKKSDSDDDFIKKTARPNNMTKSNESLSGRHTPTRKSNSPKHDEVERVSSPLGQKKSNQSVENARRGSKTPSWNKEDEKLSITTPDDKIRNDKLDKAKDKSDNHFPRTSQQSMKTSKLKENETEIKPGTSNSGFDNALKTVQSALRGHLHRSELTKGQNNRPRTPTVEKEPKIVNDDDDDDVVVASDRPQTSAKRPSFQLGSGRKDFTDSRSQSPISTGGQVDRNRSPVSTSKQNLYNDRNHTPISTSKRKSVHEERSQSPISSSKQNLDDKGRDSRSQSPISTGGQVDRNRSPVSTSKQNLYNDRNHTPISTSKRKSVHEERSQSPISSSKQNLDDKGRFNQGSRPEVTGNRDSSLRTRQPSPPPSQRPPSRQSSPPVSRTNSPGPPSSLLPRASRKSPTPSKHSFNDDDDVM